jgi:hypothetical protein
MRRALLRTPIATCAPSQASDTPNNSMEPSATLRDLRLIPASRGSIAIRLAWPAAHLEAVRPMPRIALSSAFVRGATSVG